MEENIRKKLARNWFLTIQELICHEIENIENGSSYFKTKVWSRSETKDEGGGNSKLLKNGKVFAYGLDVYNGEPKIHPEYLKLKNIFLLPHLGSATKRTRWDMAFRATKNLEDFFSGKKPQDQVN